MILEPRMKVSLHNFPGFKKMTTTFFHRTALWFEMFCARNKFAKAGGTAGMGIASISCTMSVITLLFSIFF